MKKLWVVGTLALGMMQSVTSFGLVRLVENCETSDGKYTVLIEDNQGTGMERKSHYIGLVLDDKGNTVASYPVRYVPKSGSISFGHASYLDILTSGKNFEFSYPSTNTPYSITAIVGGGEEIDYELLCD